MSLEQYMSEAELKHRQNQEALLSRLKHRFEDLDIRWTTTIEKEMLKLAGRESRMIEYLKRHRNTNRDTNPEWGTW